MSQNYRKFLKNIFSSILISSLLVQNVFAAVFVVDSNGDDADNVVGDGICATAAAECTFRAAVGEANALGVGSTINFNAGIESDLSANGAVTITDNGLTIDGGGVSGVRSSGGNGILVNSNNVTIQNLNVSGSGSWGVVLNGNNATLSNNIIGKKIDGTILGNGLGGLIVSGDDASITGNTIEGNLGYGIVLNDTATDVAINGNTINNNLNYGISVTASNSTYNGENGGVEGIEIGTTSRNIITGNQSGGIFFNGGGGDGTGNVKIQRNYIGLSADGVTTNGNAGEGISSSVASLDFLIGSNGDGLNDADEGNVIAANTSHGISFTNGNTITVAGNKIGVNSTGNTAATNTGDGISINGANVGNVVIGGDAADERNVISGNGTNGVNVNNISAASNVTIQNNYIGVGANGTADIGNTLGGVSISAGNVITLLDNIISNSGGNGVSLLGGIQNILKGNKIGVDSTENAAGNGSYGIHINSGVTTSVVLGGADPGEGNTIADNVSHGVYIQALQDVSTVVSILGNSIGISASGLINTIGNGGSGIYAITGDIRMGSENDLDNLALGGGNVVSNNSSYGVALLDNVVSGLFYGNVFGLSMGRAGFYDAVGPNSKSNLYVNSPALTTLTIGAEDGVALSTKRNYFASSVENGIELKNINDVTANIVNNYIGTGYNGSVDLGNAMDGIYAEDGTLNILNNLISGNNSDGIDLRTDYNGGLITGNIIGMNADKDAAIANGNHGISFGSSRDAATVTIGGVNAADRNYISGNTVDGVNFGAGDLNSISATFLNNFIGLMGSGVQALANGATGINVDHDLATVTIGNGAATGKNVISGNTTYGMKFSEGLIRVINNIIGLNATGDAAVANVGGGIYVTENSNVTIGNGVAGAGNVISGNTGAGVEVDGGTLTMKGNLVGLNSAGDAAIGNGSGNLGVSNYGGVFVVGNGVTPTVTIGGGDVSDANLRNVISGNYGHGVMVIGTSTTSINGNCIGTDVNCTAAVGNVDGDTNPDVVNGAGIAVFDAADLATTGPTIENNVVSGNAGAGIAILHSIAEGLAGGGQDWGTGYIKSNFIGILADGVTALSNGDYAIYADSNSTDTIADLSIGAALSKNVIDNSLRAGIYLKDVTPTNLATTISDDNTWFDSVCAIRFNWVEKLVGGVLNSSLPLEAFCQVVAEERSSGGGGGLVISSRTPQRDAVVTPERDPAPSKLIENLDRLREEALKERGNTQTQTPSTAPIVEERPQVQTPPRVIAPPRVVENSVDRAIRNFVVETRYQDDREIKKADRVAESVELLSRLVSIESADRKNSELKEVVVNEVKDLVATRISENISVRIDNRTLTENTKVLVVPTIEEAKSLREENKDKDVLVVGPDSDTNGNSVADFVEISLGVNLSEEDQDDDGLGISDELFFGFDPLQNDEFPAESFVANANGKKLGFGKYSFRIGSKNQQELELVAVNKETEEEFILGKTAIDIGFKGEITYDTSLLKPGKYYMFTRNGNEVGEVSEVEITDENIDDAPAIRLSGGYVWVSENPEEVSLAAAELVENTTAKTMKLSGHAEPGTVINVSWKSVIMSSTVITDANGEFELDVPVEGEHEVLVYAGDMKNSFMTRLSKLFFIN